jgi:ubiquinone/menaquinone biosynthesis C-methylase UbiE
MLGPGFPFRYLNLCNQDYVVPDDLIGEILANNASFDTGSELRTDKIYEFIIWEKIKSFGLNELTFNNKDVFEMCAGTGFLTYHILNRVQPNRYTANDISKNEIDQAKKLLNSKKIKCKVDWLIADIHVIKLDQKYDIIIGHSFLHHFYDVPKVLEVIYKSLKPGGIFIALSEPTLTAPIIEGRKFYFWPIAILFPKYIINLIRKRNQTIFQKNSPDVWLFEKKKLDNLLNKTGFERNYFTSFHLLQTIISRLFKIKIDNNKSSFSWTEKNIIKLLFTLDRFLNLFFPYRCFSHFGICCYKSKSQI